MRKRARTIGAGSTPYLTTRQIEVLRCLARELRPQDVAEQLHLATATVRMHIQRANARLGTHSYFASLLLLKERGILDPPADDAPTAD